MRQEIAEAAARIAGQVRRTPVIRAAFDGVEVELKLELLQHTGSFKPRGAFNRMLSSAVPPAGVIAASGGNHGLAVAYAASGLGVRCEVFIPETTPPLKITRLRRYGAHVTVTGVYYADALEASYRRAEETGALIVHAYDQPEVVAGQGTVGLELAERLPDIDTVMVSVGGGGLIGGIAGYLGGRVRLVGVEPVSAPTLFRALEAGRPVDVEVSGVAADSLGARRVGELAFDLCRSHVEEVVLVEDSDILRAQHRLWDELHLVAEPGGVAALAALLAGRYRPTDDEQVAVVLCGSNTDPGQLR